MSVQTIDFETTLEKLSIEYFGERFDSDTFLLNFMKARDEDDGIRTYYFTSSKAMCLTFFEAQTLNARTHAVRIMVSSVAFRHGGGGTITLRTTQPLNPGVLFRDFCTTVFFLQWKTAFEFSSLHLPFVVESWWMSNPRDCLRLLRAKRRTDNGRRKTAYEALANAEDDSLEKQLCMLPSNRDGTGRDTIQSNVAVLLWNRMVFDELMFRVSADVFDDPSEDLLCLENADSVSVVVDGPDPSTYLAPEVRLPSSETAESECEEVETKSEPAEVPKVSGPKPLGKVDLSRVAFTTSDAAEDSMVTSLSCIRKMYSDPKREYVSRWIPGDATLKFFRSEYEEKPNSEDGKRVCKTRAYTMAKKDATDRECGIFAFDSGLTSDDPIESAKLQFNKLYFTGGYKVLLALFLRGNNNLCRYNRETGMREDVGLHRCAYECLMFHRVSKFFIDLEFATEYNRELVPLVPTMMQNLVDFVMEMAASICGTTLVPGDFVVFSSDSDKKISRHLICLNPRFSFRTMLALSWFYLMCSAELETRVEAGDTKAKSLLVRDKNNHMTWFWDFCTTKEFQLFRAPFADKFGAKRRLVLLPENNYFSEGVASDSYADQFARMPKEQQFLNGLIQYPWKGKWPKVEHYVDFRVTDSTRIGRFECVVRDGMLVGFSVVRAGARNRLPGMIRTKTFLACGASDLPNELAELLSTWLAREPIAKPWRGVMLDTARYKFVSKVSAEYMDVLVEFKGTGEKEGGAFCYRRNLLIQDERDKQRRLEMEEEDPFAEEPAAPKRQRTETKSPTHTNAPVLLFFHRNPSRGGLWEVTQTCNKVACGAYRPMVLMTCPKHVTKMLNKHCLIGEKL